MRNLYYFLTFRLNKILKKIEIVRIHSRSNCFEIHQNLCGINRAFQEFQ